MDFNYFSPLLGIIIIKEIFTNLKANKERKGQSHKKKGPGDP